MIAFTDTAPSLMCPRCERALVAAGELLRHTDGTCTEVFPVIDGIPRLVTAPSVRRRIAMRRGPFGTPGTDAQALRARWSAAPGAGSLYDRVVSDFDDEWSAFAEVGTPELSRIFDDYFDLIPPARFAPDQLVLDAGCGAGRWALELARRGPRVLAVDLGLSIELAARNCASTGRVLCVEADLLELPVAEASVDWAYTLGVLHHLRDPLAALRRIVRSVRPGGVVLVYVYHALEGRPVVHRALFRGVDLVRRALSHLPRRMTRVIALVLALLVYLPLARAGALLTRMGLRGAAAAVPLAYYRRTSFRIMRNDALDRFGTRVERRYRRREVEDLLRSAGLEDIRISERAPFWHAVGTKAS